jgi:twitching motility two-component system response regulator PilH
MVQRILVVDDSATERQAIVNPLAREGYQVVAATDGEEAMAQLEQSHFDLMVLDVVMPGKNGFQLCRQIRKDARWSELPIVLVTSKDGDADKFWGMKQGASDYITKPFVAGDLLAAVRKHAG